MANLYNCTIENFIETQNVETQNVQEMIVQSQVSRANVQAKPFELTERQQAIFDKAVQVGLMERNGEGYEWKKDNALLDYFCGVVFCGDRAEKGSDGLYNWTKTTQKNLPAKGLNALFGKRNIGGYRNKRQYSPIPDNYEMIDDLVKSVV